MISLNGIGSKQQTRSQRLDIRRGFEYLRFDPDFLRCNGSGKACNTCSQNSVFHCWLAFDIWCLVFDVSGLGVFIWFKGFGVFSFGSKGFVVPVNSKPETNVRAGGKTLQSIVGESRKSVDESPKVVTEFLFARKV